MISNRVRGFTVIEVIVVLVVLAAIAVVVLPQFTSSTTDKQRITAQYNLSTLRSLIQAYKSQHRNMNPPCDSKSKTLAGLLNKTHVDGTVDNGGTIGPYLVAFPANPYTGVRDVKTITNHPATAGDVTPRSSGGWLYNEETGGIWLDLDPGYEL